MTKTTLYRIELELAQQPGSPQGDSGHRYRLYLPLDTEGRIDVAAYRDLRDWCRVIRKRPDEEQSRGRILRGPGGRWVFDYTGLKTRDDGGAIQFSDEGVSVGSYVSILEDDGRAHAFRVVSSRPD